jgi:hypothetical protein
MYGMLRIRMARDNAHKPPNHALSEMKCPASLEDVDLFGPGAQEHWYEAYEILHSEAPAASRSTASVRQFGELTRRASSPSCQHPSTP